MRCHSPARWRKLFPTKQPAAHADRAALAPTIQAALAEAAEQWRKQDCWQCSARKRWRMVERSRPRIATCAARVTGRRRDGHECSGDQHDRSGATRTSKQDRWQKNQEFQPSTPLIEGSSNRQFQYGVAGVWVKLVKPQSRWIELAADLCASTAARGSLARWGMGKIERRTDPNWEFFRAFSSACHVQRTRWK